LPEQNQETSIWSNADGVIDATFVKGLEQEYKSNLEVNLKNLVKGFNYHYTVYEKMNGKVLSRFQMPRCCKSDTSFPKAALDSIIKTVSTLPSDKIYQQDQ
jgi:2-oxoglutarate dehydrogenase E1 component